MPTFSEKHFKLLKTQTLRHEKCTFLRTHLFSDDNIDMLLVLVTCRMKPHLRFLQTANSEFEN
jgi:hypothetical protein